MTDFLLRPMGAPDGPGIDALMREQPQSGGVALSTRYEHDVYASLTAQHPTLFGVVAESPEVDGLAGMATAFTTEVTVSGRVVPAALLENLKVHRDVRRQGLGGRLAAWRIEAAERRFGGDGLTWAGIEAGNEASLATAARWATQLLGPVRVIIDRVSAAAPTMDGIRVRALEERDIERVVEGVNTYHAAHELYPPQTTSSLAASLASTSLGIPIRQYRVALDGDRGVVAGVRVVERYRLMTDHLDRVPAPVALLSMVLPVIPRDRVIRSIELDHLWHAPGHGAALRRLWDAVRYEWRDRATNVSAVVDPRGPTAAVLGPGSRLAPRVRLMVPVRSRLPVDADRPLCLWR